MFTPTDIISNVKPSENNPFKRIYYNIDSNVGKIFFSVEDIVMVEKPDNVVFGVGPSKFPVRLNLLGGHSFQISRIDANEILNSAVNKEKLKLITLKGLDKTVVFQERYLSVVSEITDPSRIRVVTFYMTDGHTYSVRCESGKDPNVENFK